MNRLSRDAWLAIGLVVLLLGVTFAAGLQQTQQEKPPPYASFSAAPDGTLALARWLAQIGFSVSSDVHSAFQPPDNAALIVVLEPTEPISAADWDSLDKWVGDGGTLLLAGDTFTAALAINHYHFAVSYLDQPQETLSIQTPLLVSPPITAGAAVHAGAYLTTRRSDYVTHLAIGGRPVLVSLTQGKGRLLISAAPFPFSNEGLKQASNPSLVLNLVRATAHAGGIWFDEWHHGIRADSNGSASGPENWLFTTLGGKALLYVGIVVFVALLLQGRSFGRPLSQVRERARRSPLEYVTAIANLNRRAGHRHALLEDYRHRLKRDLGRRYRLSPSLDDAEFARQIAIYRPDLNTQDLLALLTRLRQPVSSETELVELAARVAAWLDEKPGGSA